MSTQNRLERTDDSIGTDSQPKIAVSYRGVSYPDLLQRLGQRCLVTEEGTRYAPVGSLVEKSDFWDYPSEEKTDQFRKGIIKYKEQFEQMLGELQQVYNSGLSFSTLDGQQLKDFKSFVLALTQEPVLRAQGEALLSGFKVMSDLGGVDIDFRNFHEYLLSYQLRSRTTETNCRYYNEKADGFCTNEGRYTEWKEDIGPSSDDFRIHRNAATCEGIECGKYENEWGNLKPLEVIVSKLETSSGTK